MDLEIEKSISKLNKLGIDTFIEKKVSTNKYYTLLGLASFYYDSKTNNYELYEIKLCVIVKGLLEPIIYKWIDPYLYSDRDFEKALKPGCGFNSYHGDGHAICGLAKDGTRFFFNVNPSGTGDTQLKICINYTKELECMFKWFASLYIVEHTN